MTGNPFLLFLKREIIGREKYNNHSQCKVHVTPALMRLLLLITTNIWPVVYQACIKPVYNIPKLPFKRITLIAQYNGAENTNQ